MSFDYTVKVLKIRGKVAVDVTQATPGAWEKMREAISNSITNPTGPPKMCVIALGPDLIDFDGRHITVKQGNTVAGVSRAAMLRGIESIISGIS